MAKNQTDLFPLIVTQKQLREFERIIEVYRPYTVLPEKDNWKEKSNNALWLHHIGQVMVVGGAAGKERFDSHTQLQEAVAFERLNVLSKDEQLKTINAVLRKTGVRYAGKDYRRCAKSKALVANLHFLSACKDGLKGLLTELDAWSEEDAEQKRVDFLMQNLAFMKSKSARDFLMGLGMNQHTLALDIRIQNVFQHLRIQFPSAAQLGKESIYKSVEAQIVETICRPLNVLPLVFDRILFQHYLKIARSVYTTGLLF